MFIGMVELQQLVMAFIQQLCIVLKSFPEKYGLVVFDFTELHCLQPYAIRNRSPFVYRRYLTPAVLVHDVNNANKCVTNKDV